MEKRKMYFQKKNLTKLIFSFCDVESLKAMILNKKLFKIIFNENREKGFFMVLNFCLHNYSHLLKIENLINTLPTIFKEVKIKFEKIKIEIIKLSVSLFFQLMIEKMHHNKKKFCLEKRIFESFSQIFENFTNNIKFSIKISIFFNEIDYLIKFLPNINNIYSISLNLNSIVSKFEIFKINFKKLHIIKNSNLPNDENTIVNLLKIVFLEEIELKVDTFLLPYKFILVNNCKCLVKLFISTGDLNLTVNYLTSSLNQCQFLKKFSLLYNSIHLINEFKLINIIFGLKNLEKLLISLNFEENKKYFLLSAGQYLKLKKLQIGQNFDDNFLTFLSNQNSLNHISINFSKDMTLNHELFNIIAVKKPLKKVEIFINNNQFNPLNYTLLESYLSFIKFNQSIKKVIFNNCSWYIEIDEFYSFLINLLQSNKNISHLSVYGDGSYNLEFGTYKMMKIEENTYFDIKILNIIDVLLKRQKGVSKISINSHSLEKLSNNSIKNFCEIMIYSNSSDIFCNLSNITLYISKIPNLLEFSDFLCKCRNLKILNLSEIVFPDEKKSFFICFKMMNFLEKFRLYLCNFKESEIIEILEYVNKKSLKFLDLNLNYFSDYLFKYLNINKDKFADIIELNLSGNDDFTNIEDTKNNIVGFLENKKYLSVLNFRTFQIELKNFSSELSLSYPHISFENPLGLNINFI